MTRLVIAGVPRAGKTTLAGTGQGVRHTDDLIHGERTEWSQVSETVAGWFDDPGPYVIEGVRTVHALRKWLRNNVTGTPCDRVVWLGTPRVALTRGQATMARGCETVWLEIRHELVARGVQVEES